MTGVVIIGTPGWWQWTPRSPLPPAGDLIPRGQLVRMAHRAQQAEHQASETAHALERYTTWLRTPGGSVARYAEALSLIARAGCRKASESLTCVSQVHRARDAEYAVDRWCDPCIAADALATVEVAA